MNNNNQLPATFSESLDGYKNNAVLRGLFTCALGLVNPLLAAAIVGMETAVFTWQEQRVKKWEALAKEMGTWESLQEKALEDEQFLHCFGQVIYAIERTQNQSKIQYFARLLKAELEQPLLLSVDEYEEFLGIIEDLSYRELIVLSVLDKYETRYPVQEGENEYQRCLRFWEKMSDELVSDYQIPRNEIDSLFIRTTRSGCYKLFRGAYYAGDTVGKGTLMPMFHRLKQIILDDH